MPELPKVTIKKHGRGYIVVLRDGIEYQMALTEEEIRALKQLLNEMKL